MMSPGGKLTPLASHPTKKFNKAKELFYPSTNLRAETHFRSMPMGHRNELRYGRLDHTA
jgi:hypothetical protein